MVPLLLYPRAATRGEGDTTPRGAQSASVRTGVLPFLRAQDRNHVKYTDPQKESSSSMSNTSEGNAG